MSDVIERVARAIAVAMHGEEALDGWPDQFGAITDTRLTADDLRDLARVAVEATREPTEGMISVGEAIAFEHISPRHYLDSRKHR